MPAVPLLVGSRPLVFAPGESDVVLRPPPPARGLPEVAAAVREALRFPLAGAPLEELARGAGRATVVVEPPALPIPGAERDPRALAVQTVVEELERLGIATGRQTLLVAGGLARRPSQREVGAFMTRDLARRYHGLVVVHDAEGDDLVALDRDGRLLVNRALVETDLVVGVSAAETVVQGGPSLLRASGGSRLLRAGAAQSLLETAASRGWDDAVAVERALSARVPVVGISLALNLPRLGGTLQGYPYDPAADARVAGSPVRRLAGVVPSPLRVGFLHALGVELTVAAVFAGPPSVAHAEALLRQIGARATALERPLDAIVVGLPHATATLPRERPNPLQSAYLGLGLALRLWRDAFPVAEGGTAILVSGFQRRFEHPGQAPYRSFLQSVRDARDPEELRRAEEAARTDERLLRAYRRGLSCHPLLPYSDWAACAPAIGRLGAVVVAACRDAAAARQLGFVETRSVAAALEMAHGRAGADARVGWLLSPPYFPLRVGGGA